MYNIYIYIDIHLLYIIYKIYNILIIHIIYIMYYIYTFAISVDISGIRVLNALIR